jgi:hypothetical protein
VEIPADLISIKENAKMLLDFALMENAVNMME